MHVKRIVPETSKASSANATSPAEKENFGVSIEGPSGFTPFSYFDPIATGTNSCGDPSLCLDTFVVQIDLSDFGVSPGTHVDRVRLHIFDVGLGTKSGDIAALGALNAGAPIPEPHTGLLLLGGLVSLVLLRQCGYLAE